MSELVHRCGGDQDVVNVVVSFLDVRSVCALETSSVCSAAGITGDAWAAAILIRQRRPAAGSNTASELGAYNASAGVVLDHGADASGGGLEAHILRLQREQQQRNEKQKQEEQQERWRVEMRSFLRELVLHER